MKHTFKVCLLLIVFLYVACDRARTFDEFDFTYNNTFETDFSIKFTLGDTVFIRENWHAIYFDTSSTAPKSETNYFAILSENERKKLDQLLKDIDFNKLDSIYYDDYRDGTEYKLFYKKGSFEKTVYVHSFKRQKETDSLAAWIYETKLNLILFETEREFAFKSMIYGPTLPIINETK